MGDDAYRIFGFPEDWPARMDLGDAAS